MSVSCQKGMALMLNSLYWQIKSISTEEDGKHLTLQVVLNARLPLESLPQLELSATESQPLPDLLWGDTFNNSPDTSSA